MNTDSRADASLQPTLGWHVGHFFYRFSRGQLRGLGTSELSDGCREFVALFDAEASGAPARMQTLIVSGHKSDP